MKFFIPLALVLTSSLLGNACGSSSKDKDETTAVAWNNTAMQAIVIKNCAISGCHAGTTSPDYRNVSEAAMKADTRARDQVASGVMPQTGSLTTAEKATFAAFYR